MQQRISPGVRILVGIALLALTALTGCGKGSSDTAAAAGGTGASHKTAAQAMDPRVKAMADDHAKGMEADALKRDAAMKKAHTP